MVASARPVLTKQRKKVTRGTYHDLDTSQVAVSSRLCSVRPDLMFYELDLADRMGSNLNKRTDDQSPEESFEGSINQFAEITLLLDPGAAMKGPGTGAAPIRVSMAELGDPISEAVGFIGKFLPDG